MKNLTIGFIFFSILLLKRTNPLYNYRKRSDYMSIIETNKLTKYYGKTLGVKDLDMRVEEGEV